LTALGANILQLKPCIEIADGRLQVAKKYRGTFERCAAAYTEDRLKGRTDLVTGRAILASVAVSDATVRTVSEAAKSTPASAK
jgi:fatty acid-binding protein DegV